jgi:uncharacterized RDD family membrane protein YckC
MRTPMQSTGYPPDPPAGYGMPAIGQRYAGFWVRFVAHVIDSIIVGGLLLALAAAIKPLYVVTWPDILDQSLSCPGGVVTFQPAFFFFLAVAILAILYNPVLWGSGGTLGQRLLGLRVVGTMTGTPIGVGRGFLRLVGYIVASIPIYLGLLWVAWDPRKQGWHDKIAGSVVIYKA